MPSVLDPTPGRKPKEEPVLKEERMPEVPFEPIKQPEVIKHEISVEIPVKAEETKKEDFEV
jgi:hypothetical protein